MAVKGVGVGRGREREGEREVCRLCERQAGGCRSGGPDAGWGFARDVSF